LKRLDIKALTLLITIFCFLFVPICRLYTDTLCDSGDSCCKETKSTEVIDMVSACQSSQLIVDAGVCKCTGNEICECEDNQSDDGSCNCPDPFEENHKDFAIVSICQNTSNTRYNLEYIDIHSIYNPDISDNENFNFSNDKLPIPNNIIVYALWLLYLY